MNRLARQVPATNASAPGGDGTRQRLRHATHGLHVHLNRHPMLCGLLKPGYPPAFYQSLLAAYFHIYRSVEEVIDEFLADPDRRAGFSYAQRHKLPWLAEDLRSFAIDPEAPAYRPLQPVSVTLPTGPGQLIGMLYAIEGATLGGQVVARDLLAGLGLGAMSGARFFNGYGDDAETARRWREFEHYADSISDDAAQLRLAEESAAAIFKLIESQLDDYHRRLVSGVGC